MLLHPTRQNRTVPGSDNVVLATTGVRSEARVRNPALRQVGAKRKMASDILDVRAECAFDFPVPARRRQGMSRRATRPRQHLDPPPREKAPHHRAKPIARELGGSTRHIMVDNVASSGKGWIGCRLASH